MSLMAELSERPDALLLSRERFISHDTISQGAVTLRRQRELVGSLRAALPPDAGDPIVGYLGHGEGLVVHTEACGVGQRCAIKTAKASSRSNQRTSRSAHFFRADRSIRPIDPKPAVFTFMDTFNWIPRWFSPYERLSGASRSPSR